MAHMDLRREVVKWALAMNTTGLVVQTSGNVSARVPGTDMMLVTPTGTPYELLKPEDVVLMSCDGTNVPDGQLLPTR
jgi:ribulose-5-phosphate 4-epimerase/fuculose-1-phosphate aldolase